jgi:hypothetical protein
MRIGSGGGHSAYNLKQPPLNWRSYHLSGYGRQFDRAAEEQLVFVVDRCPHLREASDDLARRTFHSFSVGFVAG